MLDLLEEFRGKIILSADVKRYHIAINGWKNITSMHVLDFLEKFSERGNLQYVTCTDIQRDGMLTGPSIALYKTIVNTFPQINFIASGGIRSLEDIEKLGQLKIEGAIIGKAFYEGLINQNEALNYAD